MARSSFASMIRLYQFLRIVARSLAVLARHSGHAALAAFTAIITSSLPQSATSAMVSPVAGSVTSKVFALLVVDSHSPFM